MEAQRILIRLHDESPGYAIAPDRVPLPTLQAFTSDVLEFLRPEGMKTDMSAIEVAVVKGSLAVHTMPLADAGLLADLRYLSQSEELDALTARRRKVVERWQKTAHGRRALYEISAPMLQRSIVISVESDFHADDADQWVRVERYVRGEIEDLGGITRANAHIRLPDGKSLPVATDRAVLRDDKVNRLYKPTMVRISAEYNVVTRDYRNARLIEFVEHDSRVDERELERLFLRGAKAWRDVPNGADWVEELRGNDS
ncbi:MAG: hypothetical protein H0U56_12765 [Methylibium sp.]|nr:hypothetical protein [Methylibium sp.]